MPRTDRNPRNRAGTPGSATVGRTAGGKSSPARRGGPVVRQPATHRPEHDGLNSRRRRGRGRQRPPVVQHPRDMMDAVRTLDRAEKEIVILCPFVAGPKPPDRLEDRPPQAREMVDVVVRQEHLRRPIRLEVRVVAAVFGVDLVLIGVDQVGVGRILQKTGVVEKGIRPRASSLSMKATNSPVASWAAVFVAGRCARFPAETRL